VLPLALSNQAEDGISANLFIISASLILVSPSHIESQRMTFGRAMYYSFAEIDELAK